MITTEREKSLKMKRLNRYINHLADITGKKVIVTGANSGLGFSICDILLQKGAHIVMACRNGKRAEEARALLKAKHLNGRIDIILYNQASLSSIASFAQSLMTEHSDFYALILNAGIFHPKKNDKFENSIPLTIGTNFLGPLYLIHLLQGYLVNATSEKRIILHGSLAYHFVRYKNKEEFLLNLKNGPMKQYSYSKLGLTEAFYFYSLSNQNPNVKYLLCEPGVSSTGIIRNYKKWFKTIASYAMAIGLPNTRKACLSACYLTTQKVANGNYYRPRGIMSIGGYPRLHNLKNKYVDYRIVIDGLDILEKFYAK